MPELDAIDRWKDGDFPSARSAGADTTTAFRDQLWRDQLIPRLHEFAKMPEDWDSYGAPRIKEETILFAVYVLDCILRPGIPLPEVVPSSVGGIQVEWHEKDIDLEFHISAPYECEIWAHDYRGEKPDASDEITADFSIVQEWVALLAARDQRAAA